MATKESSGSLKDFLKSSNFSPFMDVWRLKPLNLNIFAAFFYFDHLFFWKANELQFKAENCNDRVPSTGFQPSEVSRLNLIVSLEAPQSP